MSLDNNNDSKVHTVDVNDLDKILEKEKQRNKGEVWTKLDKPIKIQKLHEFAEKYGKEHNLSSKDLKLLKTFFRTCLDKNKLNKTKDVVYNKENRIINSIPALHFNQVSKNFTLKLMDKRVSTLKSLTPKKKVEKEDGTSSP
tara:strand:- start:272 stop:697 length:426 start_codon:yes stop_codon:yes gene_type:complete